MTGEMVRVKLSLSTQWKYVGGEEVQLHLYLTSILDAGEC